METPAYTSKTARKAFELITSASAIAVVYFTKRTTGELRRMVCTFDPAVTMRYNPAAKNVLPVFDVEKGEYRTVSLDRVLSVVVASKRHRIGTFGPSDQALMHEERYQTEHVTGLDVARAKRAAYRAKVDSIVGEMFYDYDLKRNTIHKDDDDTHEAECEAAEWQERGGWDQ